MFDDSPIGSQPIGLGGIFSFQVYYIVPLSVGVVTKELFSLITTSTFSFQVNVSPSFATDSVVSKQLSTAVYLTA